MCHTTSAVNLPGANASSQTTARPEDVIRASYTKYGLDGERLVTIYSQQQFHPMCLQMTSTAKNQSELNDSRIKNLCSTRDQLVDYLPSADSPAVDQRDTELIQRLSKSSSECVASCGFVEAAKACRRRMDVTTDKWRLWEYMESLAWVAARNYNEDEVGDCCRRFRGTH